VKQINPNIYPSGGYYFSEQDGSKHPAESWQGVIARVKDYRRRQGKPVNTVENEVIFQACQRNPNLCTEDNGTTGRAQKKASLRTRVLQWLMSMKRAKEREELRYVPRDLHEARTDVCIRCPVDKSMSGGGSGEDEAVMAPVGGHRDGCLWATCGLAEQSWRQSKDREN
jgi:hypothetical protein